jgi:hypothetical protein
MSTNTPFQPKRGGNKKVTATTTSQTVSVGAGQKSLRILNSGAVVGYFRTFDSTDATDAAIPCAVTDTPIGPAGAASSTLVIEKPERHDGVAYLSDSTTTVLHFQPGEGS